MSANVECNQVKQIHGRVFETCTTMKWMFYDRNIDIKINKIRERAIRFTYKENTSQITELLGKDSLVSMHQKSLQLLIIEIAKPKID